MVATARQRALALLATILLTAACAPSGGSSAEPSEPSTSPSTPETATGNLPPGCALIELRAPSGARITLDGAWIEVGATDGNPMTWWIRTHGDCVWGAGYIDEVPPEGSLDTRPDHVQSLSGHLGSDFVITGEIISLGGLPVGAPGNPPRYSPLRMLLDFDDSGQVLLREDREPGVSGPRCPDPGGYCPAPLVLQPLDQ